MIVPGDHVVTVRCDGCGIYGNPRDFVGVVPGGRHGAYSGTYAACAEEGVGDARVELAKKGGER